MKREVCPNCGGVLMAESLGWKCKSCRGFISLQDGKFYEYVEKPFMPPMTNADRIRAMSDEELAREYALTGCPRIPDDDVCDSFCDKHTCCYNCWLDWLKQPVKDGEGDG